MSAKNKSQAIIKVGAYNTKAQQPSIVEEVDSRPATTTDVKPTEISTPKKEEPKPKKAFEPVKKKTASKVKCNPKIFLALLLTLVAIIVLVGLIFLIIYLATLGKQTKDAFCMSDYSCLTNSSLYCLNAKCSCYSNATWNSSISVCAINTTTTTTNTTNITVVTYPVNSVVKIFNGSAYGVTSVAAYSGIAFTTLYDVAYSSITDYYYISDNGAAMVVVTDSSFDYVKKAFLQDCWYIDVFNTSVYVSTNSALKIYKFDLNLFWQNTYLSTSTVSLYNVFYSTHAKMVYSCDYSNGWITAYDTSLNKINTESFSVTGTGNCVSSATVNNNSLYIGRTNSQVTAFVNKVQSASYTICSSGWVQDILIDTSTGTNYMFVSCNADKKIYLYTVASSSATSLNLFITTAGSPVGITIDQYGRLLVAMQNPNRVDVYKLT